MLENANTHYIKASLFMEHTGQCTHVYELLQHNNLKYTSGPGGPMSPLGPVGPGSPGEPFSFLHLPCVRTNTTSRERQIRKLKQELLITNETLTFYILVFCVPPLCMQQLSIKTNLKLFIIIKFNH